MINLQNYYFELDQKISFLKELHDNLQESIDKNTYHISGNQLLRTDLKSSLVEKIRKNYSQIPISDISIFKNDPGFKYIINRDKIRKCAINILLSDESDEFEVLFHEENFINKFSIPYRKNVPLLINTQQYHSIKNNSQSKVRYLLSLGCTKLDYETVKTLLKN